MADGTDRFTEALGRGLTESARSLQRMTGGSCFSVGRPSRVARVGNGALPHGSHASGSFVYVLSVQFSGDIFGGILCVLSEVDASALMQALLGPFHVEPRSTADKIELGRGALEEAINVLVNSALSAVSREMNLAIYPTPPSCLLGRFEAASRAALALLGGPTAVADPIIFPMTSKSPAEKISASVYFMLAQSGDPVSSTRDSTTPAQIDVAMGDLCVAEAPDVLKATSLGSCLAVILYDSAAKRGAMAHILLPAAPTTEKAQAHPGKYVDTAIPALLKRLNARKGDLSAWLVGGANMFPKSAHPFHIGRGNVETAQKLLREAGILHYAQEIGGSQGRSVELSTATGEVWIRTSAEPKRLISSIRP